MSDFALTPEEEAEAAKHEEPDAGTFGIARVPVGMIIQTEQDAALVVGAIQLRRTTAARIRAQAEAMAVQVERAADWIEETYQLQLAGWTRNQLTGKVKSVRLVTGQGDGQPAQLGFRTTAAHLKVVDDEKAIASAPDEFIRTKIEKSPIVAKFAEHFKATGEILPGCELLPESEKFYVK